MQDWYAQLLKPPFAPPPWLFGPVWSVLYLIILFSFGYVFFKVLGKEWPYAVALPFVINLVANLSFTYFQFGLRNNWLALVDILVVLFTIVWMMRTTWLLAPWVSYLQIPYLLWVGFATVLQASITWLNR